MRRYPSSLLVSLCLALTACSFSPHAAGVDSGVVDTPDAGTLPVVGFQQQTSMTDHNAGTIMVPVLVTGTVANPVTVHYGLSGGTAASGTDFTFTAGTLTFTDNQPQGVPVTLKPVGVAEGDLTIILQLTGPTGATLDTNAQQHTITISPQILPRVTFKASTSQVNEANANAMIEVDLDTLSAFDVNVTLAVDTVHSTAVDPTNFHLDTATPLTIPAGMPSAQLAVAIKDDQSFDDNLDIALQLVAADTAVVGTSDTHTLTIIDTDPAPTATFSAAGTAVNETGVSTTLTVQLVGATTKTVTVPFKPADTGTTADVVDFSYPSIAPLSFSPGTTTQTITINLNLDTDCIDNETVVTSIDGANLVNATLGATPANTVTIHDDTGQLVGPSDAFQVCLDPKPIAAANIAANTVIDTDGGAPCNPSPFGWTTTQNQADACFVIGTDVTIGTNVSAKGTRPLVFAATGTITVGSLDVSSNHTGTAQEVSGPGLPPTGSFSDCSNFARNPQASNGNGAGGGAGASFMSKAGNGGNGNGVGAGTRLSGVAAGADATPPALLRPGCDGQAGGTASTSSPGAAGRGGGAVYLVGKTLALDGSTIDASGAGGAGSVAGTTLVGGSGGGSGGMIKLFGLAIQSNATTTLLANGGGASSGAPNNNISRPGADPSPATPTTPAAGGTGNGSVNGGNGFAGATQATTGSTANGKGGGGGGGGGGYIQANLALTGTQSAGLVQAP